MNTSVQSEDDRTPPEELLPRIADQFCVYIGKGLEFNSIFQNADPDLNINGLDDLLDIHFLLSGEPLAVDQTERPEEMPVGVRDFLTLLPPRLRRLHTTTERETRIFNGEIRGRIDWRGTIQERYRTGTVDGPIYACQLAEETVITPENIVLWELIDCIRRAHREASELIPGSDGPAWFEDWQGDSALRDNLELARSNVHLSELDTERDSAEIVTDRTIRNVLDSRSPLYSEAAELLQRYRRLHDHEMDEKEAKNILSHRLFYPGPGETWEKNDTPTFFELYWIFNLLEAYSAAERNLVTQGTRSIATWSERGSEYQVYHDWTGDDQFAFGESYFDREREQSLSGEDGYLGRTTELLATHERESRQVFGHSPPKEKTRRPDFVILRKEEGAVRDIAIGEVKYTRNTSTAARGLRELYRYMIFARELVQENPQYFTTGPEHFQTPNVHGFLCVDKINYNRSPEGNVNIVQVGDEVPPPF